MFESKKVKKEEVEVGEKKEVVKEVKKDVKFPPLENGKSSNRPH